MKWLACELHTHTIHSDGKQTLQELAEGAVRLGFECIALTDHNTMSGLEERERVERETGITIIPGMEWTTFYGHMLAIGAPSPSDWRLARPDNLAEVAAEVRRLGGLTGLAHPYRIGNPVCTGCFWEFEIRDWRDYDYIEVWSKTFAPAQADNRRAFRLWTDLLNAGVRIAAVSGRDWHEQTETEDPVSVLYLGIEEEEASGSERVAEAAISALRAGRASVTIGPLLALKLRSAAGREYGLGDVVPQEESGFQAVAEVVFSVRAGLWQLDGDTLTLAINSGIGMLAERRIATADERFSFHIEATERHPGWVRAELWGSVRGAHVMIAFTNAIYFD